MKPTLLCLRVVLPGDTFIVLGFHVQLDSGLRQSYTPVRYPNLREFVQA